VLLALWSWPDTARRDALVDARTTPPAVDVATLAPRWWHDGAWLGEAGGQLLKVGRVDDADRLLSRAVVRDPNDFRAWRLLAGVRTAAGDASGAAAAWAEALKRWPRDGMDLGKPFDEAFATLPVGVWWLDALQDAPAHWSVRLARRMLADGDPETALLACEQAAALRPVVHGRSVECALSLARLERTDEAVAYLRAWRVERPGDVWAHIATAQILGEQGKGPTDPEWAAAVTAAYALRRDEKRVQLLLERVREQCAPPGTAGRPDVCKLADVAAP